MKKYIKPTAETTELLSSGNLMEWYSDITNNTTGDKSVNSKNDQIWIYEDEDDKDWWRPAW